MSDPMPANPVLAQFLRGGIVENRHRGAICVADANGRVLAGAGDIRTPVFPRSAIKAIQALALFSSGAVERFDLAGPPIALACASHSGETEHTEGVARVLSALGLGPDALECGVHPPIDPVTRRALMAAGEKPSTLHNACSGKHAGMLAVARALDVDSKGYSRPDHPVQVRVRDHIEEVIGVSLIPNSCGMDGCSIPTFAASLHAFATGFARMATGQDLAAETAAAARSIFDAATGHPFLVGGSTSFDTRIMDAFKGRLMIKFGADGIFCGAVRDTGIGFALKCDDGSVPAARAIVAGLLGGIAGPDREQSEALSRYAEHRAFNWAGHEVGVLEATPAARLTV